MCRFSLVFAAAAVVVVEACQNRAPSAAATSPGTPAGTNTVKAPHGNLHAVPSTTRTPGGVLVEEIKVGGGAEAAVDSTIVFHGEAN